MVCSGCHTALGLPDRERGKESGIPGGGPRGGIADHEACVGRESGDTEAELGAGGAGRS